MTVPSLFLPAGFFSSCGFFFSSCRLFFSSCGFESFLRTRNNSRQEEQPPWDAFLRLQARLEELQRSRQGELWESSARTEDDITPSQREMSNYTVEYLVGMRFGHPGCSKWHGSGPGLEEMHGLLGDLTGSRPGLRRKEA